MKLILLLVFAALLPAAVPDPRVPSLLPLHKPALIEMSPERLRAALNWARHKVAGYEKLEKARVLPSGSLSTHHQRYSASDPEIQWMGREALAWVEAARAPANLSEWATEEEPSRATRPTPRCSRRPRFRRQDGACNNAENPLWGASDTPLVRMRPDTFEDGVNAPRSRGRFGSRLSSARLISQRVTGSSNVVNRRITLSLVNFAQFLDHDFTLSPIFATRSGEELECCRNGQVITSGQHPQCLPIMIPSNDPFFGPLRQRCMNFARSIPAAGSQPGPTITKNVLTAFIDGSGIYGSRSSRAYQLRTRRGGLLKTQGRNLLPRVRSSTETLCFSPDQRRRPCFMAGDVRSNEQSGLAMMHTIWLREHNRIARALASINRCWNDERLFQEARRIVGAELQHIVYNEWLPLVIGRRYMQKLNIETQRRGYSSRYSPEVDPSIATEFSTAAYRFGHTMIQGQIQMFQSVQSPPPPVSRAVNVRDVFFDPALFYEGRLGELAIGMITQNAQTCDANFAEDLSEFLFVEKGGTFGMDLVALNIQRGRDHGIATYNTMREHCFLGRVASFTDLLRFMPLSVVSRLRSVYRHVDDIDLFVGAVSERPVFGAAVGPTIRCILADQFARLRWGDNFFYDLVNLQRWRTRC
ncbi:chorion peroxidase-like [Pollicipes pollicipes]|uniref:chorion peroxidase-like n=1 Tax=Pollicipes pollicipes TaxID=41117 RepID=UPI0018849C94|nr:chorion peroxidase-like [Pollicipes pollicipes]